MRKISTWAIAGAMALLSVVQAVNAAPSAQAEMNKLAIKSLPVFAWLVVGESTSTAVLPKLQQGNLILQEGVFAYDPQGKLINASKPGGPGIEGETGLRIISLGFGKDRRLESVTMMIERGWKDKNVPSLVDRMTTRYGVKAKPMIIRDERGDSADIYMLFDLGRFVVEVSVPEQGSFVTVIFTTRDLYEKMKKADRTDDLLLPHLAAK